ncbi:MAG: TraB/GumN family protein [Pseudomonadota bacterium]
MPLRGLVLSLATVALLQACSPSNDTAPDIADVERPVATIDIEGPAIWRVADEDTTVYLYGTVHVLRAGTDWLDEDIVDMLSGSDALYFEADVDSAVAQSELISAVTELGLYTDGSTLSERLDEAAEKEVDEALALLGVPRSSFDNMRPWLAAIQMSDLHLMGQGFSRDGGVERILGQRARSASIPLRYLETGAEQIELLSGLSEDSQIDMLVETARQIEDEPDILDEMIAEWAEGDVEALATLVTEDETFVSEEATEVMLTNRNANWAVQIDALMNDEAGVFFVAVGAAHLVGDGKIQDQLQDFGHIADRL